MTSWLRGCVYRGAAGGGPGAALVLHGAAVVLVGPEVQPRRALHAGARLHDAQAVGRQHGVLPRRHLPHPRTPQTPGAHFSTKRARPVFVFQSRQSSRPPSKPGVHHYNSQQIYEHLKPRVRALAPPAMHVFLWTLRPQTIS